VKPRNSRRPTLTLRAITRSCSSAGLAGAILLGGGREERAAQARDDRRKGDEVPLRGSAPLRV
jgi:hypothetical protein